MLYISEMCSLFFVVFFFKQKTAYEMRISDWSSDVCSSDLRVAQLLLDAQKLIVFRDALASSGRAALDLPRVHRDGQVGDRGVLGLARAVRQHRGVARAVREVDRVERLRQGSDLVDLHQQGVRRAAGDALGQEIGRAHV